MASILTEQSAHNYRNYCESYNIVESKSALENFLRRDLFNVYESSQSFEAIESYIELAFELANELKIENSIPFLLIEDIVEIASFDRLGQLLPYLDRKASEWCSKLSSKKGNGLILLRTVNLMRRRIIRSEHSNLAGLALLLLSKIFPVNERSGLNLKGERNLENCNLKLVPEFTKEDHVLFWKLHELMYSTKHGIHDLFNPLQNSINHILETIDNVLKIENSTVFSEARLDVDEDFFTPQFLTECDSFSKQINNVSFRLSILAQILVALQDLSIRATSELSKSSKPELILDEKQNEWINESTKKAFLLVSQHPNGRVHFRFLRHVIRSERNWIKWKALSCPDFENGASEHLFEVKYKSSSPLPSPVELGNDELGRLWCYNSTSVCDRNLRPAAKEYLERYLEDDEDENSLHSNVKWRLERLRWKERF